MRSVLVTGGAGFIGSNFIHYLLKKEPNIQIHNLDLLTYAGNLENLKSISQHANYDFIEGDICDRELVGRIFQDKSIDTVVHFAAESHVDRSIAGPMPFIQTNVVGTATLLEAAREAWAKAKAVSLENARFHHVSTDEVFGSLRPDDEAFNENTAYAPNSPYSASKAASDHLVRAYNATYNLPISITNCSNNYGPYQFPEKLIPLIIMNALENKPLPVYGDGLQIRDWLFVEDHCEAIYQVLTGGQPGETYSVGGNNQPTNMEIVQTICEILDEIKPLADGRTYKELIQFVADRPGHDRRYAMDITKITQTLGWQPRHTLIDGLRFTIQWYLENMEWVETIRKRASYQSWMEINYAGRASTK